MKSGKIISLILTVILLLTAFTGCTGNGANKTSVFEASTQASTEAAAEVTTAEATTAAETTTEAATEAPTTEVQTTAQPKTEAATAAETKAETKAETSDSADSQTDKKRPAITMPRIRDKIGKKRNEHFFDDTVFIGDSVTLGLKNYVTNQRNNGNECLGTAQFLAAVSMSYTNSLGAIGKKNTIHPKYKGSEVMVDEGVRLIGAKKAFIMLGLNEFCGCSIEASMSNAKTFVNRIIKKNPGIDIYIQSVTPVISAKEEGDFTNASVNKYNNALKNLCAENGWTYVDVASAVKDENGCLRDDYCGDKSSQGVHMNNAGYRAWAEYLTDKFC